MSGHSKWSNIKHRKEAQDGKRASQFQKMSKDILIAIKTGGPNVEFNSSLRSIITKAKSLNMPRAKIDGLIKNATSKKNISNFEEVMYEAYLPGGIAVIIECVTDNKKRTSPIVKTAINKLNGNIATSGAVSRLFHRKGLFHYENDLNLNEESLFEKIIDLEIDKYDISEDSIKNLHYRWKFH